MREKYRVIGLDYDLIKSEFPDLNEYENVVNVYFSDPYFMDLEEMLDTQDYEMAKDTVKGLYYLAQDLKLFPLYFALVEIFEDLEDELYSDVMGHYKEMIDVYNRMRGVFCA